jgi:hypothetical protein
MTYYKQLDFSVSIHHSLTMTGFFWALTKNTCVNEVIYGFLLAEISNFPMHFRKILL